MHFFVLFWKACQSQLKDMGPGNNAKRVRENESNISLVMVDIIIPNSTSSPPGSNFLSHAPPPQSLPGDKSPFLVYFPSLFMCSPALCSMDSFHLSSPFYPCFTHFHTYLHTKWFKAKQDNALGVSGGNKSAVAFKAHIPRFENFQIFALPSWVVLGGFKFLSFLKHLFSFGCAGLHCCTRVFSSCREWGCSSWRCMSFSWKWLFLLWSTGLRCMGFSSCSMLAHYLQLLESRVWA